MNDDDRLADIILRWREDRGRGQIRDPEEVIRAHPDLASRLRRRFATLAAVDEIVADAHGPRAAEPRRLGGYALMRELGTGGMGAVYLATAVDDSCATALGEEVAVKVLHSHLLARPGFFKRFLKEAEIGRRVTSEHVVRVHEVDAALHRGSQMTYLVMEYVEGRTLRALLDDLGNVPESLLREIARQTASGLVAIHAEGIVHRDIKPENLIISSDQRLRIMDLGVAHDSATLLAQTREGEFAGTLAYAAPEQFGRDGNGSSIDLYALGVVLYELASGWNPFRGEDAASCIRAHLEDTPRRLDELGLGISTFLSEVVATLLTKHPEDRFVTAQHLLDVLETAERGDWWRERRSRHQDDATLHRPVIPVRRETPLHGRDEILSALTAAFGAVSGGEGAVVLIEGEAGIGKTRLVDAFLGELDLHDATVLYGSYPPSGGSSGLADAIVSLFGARGLDDALAAHLDARTEFARRFAAYLQRTATEGVSAPTREGIHAAFDRLLSSLASSGGTVVWIVDDLHFASEDERRIVLSLARTAAYERVLLVLTSRPGLPADFLSHFGRLPRFARQRLPRLSAREVIEVLKDALRSEDLAVKLGGRIAYKSDGVPFFVFEMIRGLREGQFITELPDGSWVETRVVDEISVPSAVRDLIAARLTPLTREERVVLDVCAVQGYAFDASVTGSVLDRPRIAILQDLAAIERMTGVIQSIGDGFRFDHHQIQELAYDAIPCELRREYHLLAGDAIAAGRSREPGASDELDGETAYLVCTHLLRAGRGHRARSALAIALDHLSRHERAGDSVELLRLALDSLPDADVNERLDLMLQLARMLQSLGRREEERTVAEEAVRIADEHADPAWQAHTRNALGGCLCETKNAKSGIPVLEKAIEYARKAEDPISEARALGNIGLAHTSCGRYDDAQAASLRVIELARSAGATGVELIERLNLAATLDRRGDKAAARRLWNEVIEAADSNDLSRCRAAAEIAMGGADVWAGSLREAREHAERGLEIARNGGYRPIEARALTLLGLIAAEYGDYEAAGDLHQRRRSIARCTGDLHGEDVATSNLVDVHVGLGELVDASREVRAHLRLSSSIGRTYGVTLGLLQLAGIQILMGRLDPLRRTLRRALAGAQSLGAEFLVAGVALVNGEAALLVRAHDEARRHLQSAIDAFGRGGVRETMCLIARTRMAETLEALGDTDRARHHLSEAWQIADDGELLPAGLIARLRMSLLTGREDVAALRRFSENEARLGVPFRLEARYVLWKMTGQLTHLREARRLLQRLMTGLPARQQETMTRNVPRHREIVEAWSASEGETLPQEPPRADFV